MPSVTDFLFNGQPPPQVNSYGSTTAGLPDWVSAYGQGIASQSNAIAAEPYQTYGGPRIAGLTPDQQAAFEKARATGPTSSEAAAPYLSKAGSNLPDNIDKYMDPYTDKVVDRIGVLGGRNLRENLLPQVGDTFTRAGQFGSTRHEDFAGRAVRDTQDSVLAAQAQALMSGYKTAGDFYNADANRQGALASTAGSLADVSQQERLREAAAQEAVGTTQQNLTQRNYDTAYTDFLEQREYPRTNIQFLNNAIRGVPYPTSTNTTQSGPGSSFQPSPLSQIAGAGIGLGALTKLLKARGGRISGPAIKFAQGGGVLRHAHV